MSVGYHNEAVFTMTRNGGLKLIHQNLEFFKFRTKNRSGVTYWRCMKFSRFKCKGKAMTQKIGLKEMVKFYGIHNHPSGDVHE